MTAPASAPLRICLVGHDEGAIDEGMKKVAASLRRELSRRHEVLVFNPTRAGAPAQWSALRRFRPHLVHYIPGPSAMSFALARALRAAAGGCPLVMSAIHPKDVGPAWLHRALRPDLFLVQSPRVERLFEATRAPIRYLPLGVDLERFRPVEAARKAALRKELELPEGKPVALHVGNLREGRNVRILAGLAERGFEVVVVGSTSVEQDEDVSTFLQERGVRVWRRYFPRVEEVYQAADLYVFPVRRSENAIEFPLSVLEAMGAGLPVVTTPFGGLPRFLEASEGLAWLDRDEDLAPLAEEMLRRDARGNRAVAERFTWDAVARSLESHYRSLLEGAP